VRIGHASDIGRCVRSERRRLGFTQTQLCDAAQVSRRWLSDLEAGKATAEIGLVLRVMHALDLRLDVSPARSRPDQIDLDDILAAYAPKAAEDGSRG
jgi:y4mF family transcriptional regulator